MARSLNSRTEVPHGHTITRPGREFADLTGDSITFEPMDEDESRKVMGLPAKIRARVDLTESGAVSSPRDTASSDASGRFESNQGSAGTQCPLPRSDARRGTDADKTAASRSRSSSPRARRPRTPQYRVREHALRGTSPVSPRNRSAAMDSRHAAAHHRNQFEGFREIEWSASTLDDAAALPTTAPDQHRATGPQKPTEAHRALHLENLAHYCVRDRYNHQQKPCNPWATFYQDGADSTNGALPVQAPWAPEESAIPQPSSTPFQKMLNEQRAVMRERLREEAMRSGQAERQRSAVQEQQQPKSAQQFFAEQVALLLEAGRRQQ